MIQIEVNQRSIPAAEGETLLTALKRAGVEVPTLCHLEGFLPTGACRLCVVEVEGMRGLVPACSYPVAPGMKVHTHSERALNARRTVLELLLAGHPDDCLYCGRNGSCRLQSLAAELGVRQRRYPGRREPERLDVSSPAIVRDPAKCILCGKCVRVCEEVQGVAAIDFLRRGSRTVVGTAFDRGLNVSSCINCGQCILACPTGALAEHSHLDRVAAALADPSRVAVVQHAPSISVTIAEEFGVRPGVDVAGALVTALRRIGFRHVFDTAFAADLTIMEEASELARRLRDGGPLPLFTSCSPGWIKFVEQSYPELLPHLSTCKSPQQMLGALIKTFWAQRQGVAADRVFSVAVMPCTAKKFEAARPEQGRGGEADIDAVLTTRELAQLIRRHGLDLNELPPDTADNPFGERSTAGKLFGASGGVCEAALRTAHFLLTGRELAEPRFNRLRGPKAVKEARLEVAGRELAVAVVSGLANARALLEEVKAGRRDLAFVEVMTCPGGCVAGGGQPIATDAEAVKARMKAIYDLDRDEPLRVSHGNQEVARLYREFLGEPLGERSHHLLHTRYMRREVVC